MSIKVSLDFTKTLEVRKPNSKWYTLEGMLELNEHLLSPPIKYKIDKLCNKEDETKKEFMKELIFLTRRCMQETYMRTASYLLKHSRTYPVIPMSVEDYCSIVKRREINLKISEALEKHETPQEIIPAGITSNWSHEIQERKIIVEENDPVPPILLIGVDYSAESLILSEELAGEKLPDKDNLTFQQKDSLADYCEGGIACLTSDIVEYTLKCGLEKSRISYLTPGFKAAETISEEMKHRIADIFIKSLPPELYNIPRYGEEDVRKEHHWMNERGSYPEKESSILVKQVVPYYIGKGVRNICTDLGIDMRNLMKIFG
jgi:hypothetical protein